MTKKNTTIENMDAARAAALEMEARRTRKTRKADRESQEAKAAYDAISRIYMAEGELRRAQDLLASLPEDSRGPAIDRYAGAVSGALKALEPLHH